MGNLILRWGMKILSRADWSGSAGTLPSNAEVKIHDYKDQ